MQQRGLMNGTRNPDGTPTNLFEPARSVNVSEALIVFGRLGFTPANLDNALPKDPSASVTKSQFLQALTTAYAPELTALLKTKTQAEYTKVWNAIPTVVSHYTAVRMAILAGWIDMPQGSFHGSAPLTRAEMAKILENVLKTIGK
jgi:hypothetical protein